MHTIPIPTNERITSIDIIRGFAIIGIFFVNVPSLLIPDPLYPFQYEGINRVIRLIYDLFIQTKFYTIFSFLFGVSAFYFMNSIEKKGLSPKLYFSKRLFWMFIFGVIHMTIFWFGDILHTYAFIGIFLILFYKYPVKTLLKWSVFLFLFAVLIQTINHVGTLQNTSSSDINPFFTAFMNSNGEINFFNHFTEQIKERWGFFLSMIPLEIFFNTFEFIPLFLLGIATAKMGLFSQTQYYMKGIERVQYITLFLSIPFLILILKEYSEGKPTSLYYVYLSGKFLAAFYICTLLRVLEHVKWQKRLSCLAPLGKMAFTNYIAQTVITLVFFSLIVKNTGSISLWIQTIYVIIIIVIQIYASRFILSKWRYGPLEYLWRILTYKKINIRSKNTTPNI